LPGQSASTRNWAAAAVFVLVAALPAPVILAIEAGTMARVRALIAGTGIRSSAPISLPPEADSIAWAWAIFFIVLALVYATDTRAESSRRAELDLFDDFVEPEPEPGSEPEPEPLIRVRSEPPGRSTSSLPEVQSLGEAQAWYKKGNELYSQGRYAESIARFDRALKLYPRLAAAWAGRGLACNAMRQYDDAGRCYDEALRLDPRDPAVWHDKGNTLSAIGRLEGALNCYNEALIIDPRDARAWNNKGICLASLGRLEEAIACCDRAVELDPSYLLGWQAKGMLDERLGRTADAIAAYRQFLSLTPDRDSAAAGKIRQRLSALEASAQVEPDRAV
jgi:tetratricopeptide (TPR) repeat protein